MKVLIIEDETAAARNLQSMLEQLEAGVEIVGVTESIVDTVEWFSENENPDLVFMDIHIADGESFRIFDSVDISAPIIFTTAYDQYALEAPFVQVPALVWVSALTRLAMCMVS